MRKVRVHLRTTALQWAAAGWRAGRQLVCWPAGDGRRHQQSGSGTCFAKQAPLPPVLALLIGGQELHDVSWVLVGYTCTLLYESHTLIRKKDYVSPNMEPLFCQ